MKKDVVYIDIEDEITGIISKMKESKAKIVALVPPKRSTVLNSVVNLKLLKRAADDSKKRVVLITNERHRRIVRIHSSVKMNLKGSKFLQRWQFSFVGRKSNEVHL